MLARDVMSRELVTVAPTDRAWTAAEMLARMDLTGLPVADDDRSVLGVVTELDLIRAARRGVDLHAATVGEVMHRGRLFVEPDTGLTVVTDLMQEYQVRRLPVVQDGRLVGVISRADVLRVLVSGGVLQ